MQIADADTIVNQMAATWAESDVHAPSGLTVFVPMATAKRAAVQGIDLEGFYWRIYGAKVEII